MVRINLVKVSKLTDQHLIAEQVEILMLMDYIKRFPNLDGTEPKNFKLGKGHMKFFKDKLLYLKIRYNELHNEMLRRGFNHKWNFPDLCEYPKYLCNDWQPSYNDLMLVKNRIKDRLLKKLYWYRYCGECLSVEFYVDMLN